jgi:hypothetical protein
MSKIIMVKDYCAKCCGTCKNGPASNFKSWDLCKISGIPVKKFDLCMGAYEKREVV